MGSPRRGTRTTRIPAALRHATLAMAAMLGSDAPAHAAELLVGAAISVEQPLAEAGRRYQRHHPDVRVALTFGASSAIAAQVRAGAPIDVFVSASDDVLDALAVDGAIAADGRVALARNRIVVIVPEDESAAAVTRAEDLRSPAIARIAVPIDAVPLGGYARSWLRARGLLDVLTPKLVPTPHARATLAAVEQRHVDAAIVYATDAASAKRVRVALEIPDSEQPVIRYPCAVVASTREPERAAEFLRFLRGEEVARLFRDAGFAPP